MTDVTVIGLFISKVSYKVSFKATRKVGVLQHQRQCGAHGYKGGHVHTIIRHDATWDGKVVDLCQG